MKQQATLALWLVATMAGAQTDSLRLDSLMHTLPEVMVRGERPLVHAEPERLVFDLPHLIRDKGIATAYDALKELPGVTEQDQQLLLTGRPVTLIIDGKASTLSASQVAQLLKTLPASRISNAEVMYAAPARYRVHGQVINLNLRHDEAHHVRQGQARLGYEQQHDALFTEAASFFMQEGRWTADAMYSHSHGRTFHEGDTRSLHSQATGQLYDIRSHSLVPGRKHSHDYRLELACGKAFSLAYTGNYQTAHNTSTADGSIATIARGHNRHTLHNLRADLSLPFGLRAGADFTHYDAPLTGVLSGHLPTGKLDYVMESRQRISTWKWFAHMEHRLPHDWQLNYGTSYTTTSDRSHQHYNIDGMNSSARLRERMANLYVGGSRSWGKHLSLDLSFAAEHFSNAAYREWAPFPQLTLAYAPAEGHLLQLALTGSRSYPEYWAVTSAKGYTDGGYGEVTGNPGLRPAKDRQLQLVWLLHGKYQMAVWFQHTDDYFVQTCYQRQDRLVLDYRHLNFDFRQQAGLMVYAPVRVGQWLQSAASAYLLWSREKDSDFYDLPFDRSIVSVMANVRTTLRLSPVFSMNVNAFARSKAYQGLFDLPASGNLTVELVARALGERLTVKAYGTNLLRTNAIHPEMNYRSQHYRMGYADYRELGLTATYSFDGYQERQHQRVDTSRLRQ